jgi:hypothetical protein
MKDKVPEWKDAFHVLQERVDRLAKRVAEVEDVVFRHEMRQATREGGENQEENSKRLWFCIGGTLLAAALQYLVINLPPF